MEAKINCHRFRHVLTVVLTLAIFIQAGHGEQASRGMSIALASSICGVMKKYKETGQLYKYPLNEPPHNITIKIGCDYISWEKCEGGEGSKCRAQFSYHEKKCPTNQKRIIGGETANQNVGKAEYPWDVQIRIVEYWNGWDKASLGKPRPELIRNSRVCTGVIYSRTAILTHTPCVERGRAAIPTGQRFVVWITRGQHLSSRWLFDKDYDTNLANHSKTCDLYDSPHGGVSIIKLVDSVKLDLDQKKGTFAAIEVPPLNIPTFFGPADVAGWGRTTGNSTTDPAGRWPNHWESSMNLQKLNVTIIPDAVCSRRYRSTYACADVNSPTTLRLCAGDAGAGLVCRTPINVYLCGIASDIMFKERDTICPIVLDPSSQILKIITPLFHRIKIHQEWIEAVVGKQNKDDLYKPK